MRGGGGIEGHGALAGMARPDCLAEMTGDAKQVAARAFRRAAVAQAARHLQEGFLDEILHRFRACMPTREVAREVGGALGEEALQKRGVIRGVHAAFRR